MMITEFEKLTGIFPTSDLYKAIEAVYYEYDGNKADFCKAYKENTDGIAEKIQRAADMAAVEKALAEDKQVAKMKADREPKEETRCRARVEALRRHQQLPAGALRRTENGRRHADSYRRGSEGSPL